ncbi:hypothetical protein BD626DRAFT_563461 [Schizophyllum amplum]|uniref:Uncharacterized protein n=1 Tax=Schizophyllum amplum TaxID=97359 RepID=A0A550CY53_9AGAR|nr:hypothetical protein BD626DRAFT_563461 [Auriculariopsis ampla]
MPFPAPCEGQSDHCYDQINEEQYFSYMGHWNHEYDAGAVMDPYTGEQRQQQLPTSPGWVSDGSDLSPWPSELSTSETSQAGYDAYSPSPLTPGSLALFPPDGDSAASPEQTTMSVSTAFNANASPSRHHPPDFEITSADEVLFFVSSVMLAGASCNGFLQAYPVAGGRLRNSEPADVLNLVLHAAYGASVAPFSPSLDTIAAAIGRLESTGWARKRSSRPYDLRRLAEMASAHLLAYPLHVMTDADAEAMGALIGRGWSCCSIVVSQLRILLEPTQEFHPRTPTCGFTAQRRLATAWTRMALHVTAEGGPGRCVGYYPAGSVILYQERDIVHGLQDDAHERIWKAVVDWTMLPTTVIT